MDWLTVIPQLGKSIGDLFVNIFASLTGIFYTSPVVGTDGTVTTPGQITFIGVICLMVLFFGLCITLVNWIRSLISRR